MRMRNFDVEFTVRKFWPEIRPDYFNNTTLLLNGEVVWPLEDGENPPVLPAKGTMFRLEIPSGYLEGEIQGTTTINEILESWWIIKCTWEGKYAGLAAGNSGLGSFKCFTRPETMVESSISEKPLTYAEYIAVRRMVGAVTCGGLDQEEIWLTPEENRVLMMSALAYIKALRKEAELMIKTE